MFVHIFHVVQLVDDGIKLELDVVLLTPPCDLIQLLDIVPRPSSYINVRGFVKGVAADSKDVERLAVLAEEVFAEKTAVGDDGNGLEAQFLLAEVHHLAQKFGVEEGLAASEVDLLHAGLGQQAKTLFGTDRVLDVRGSGGMEAKSTCLVAAAGEVVVDG